MTSHAVIRIANNVPETISSAYIQVDWDKPINPFTTFRDEQRSGLREVFRTEVRGTSCWLYYFVLEIRLSAT
ncbi:hypothetical protein SAMN04488244_10134 [Vibrio hangzhouensis]|uniref:Uncharacterized protein n=1 Tax=Vibrio hangzhouensis TaxID=462991 RepID=A0A1H5RNK9_9VIBR|nr:hypothetical protein SAMN04488244_10134 [Vibrio hangzhouensis]